MSVFCFYLLTKNIFTVFKIKVMNISSVNTTPEQTPAFKAIIVKKLEPVLKQKGITFYNNGTAMLDHRCHLFDGAALLISNILKNNKRHIDTILDSMDLSRLINMVSFLPNQIFRKRIMRGVIGSGVNNTALLLDKDEVLCLSDNMNVFEQRPFEDFDLPIKKSGKYDEESGWFIRDLGQPIDKHELEDLGKNITSKGYILDDWRTEQGCKIKDKLYLLDFECAKIKLRENKF